MPIRYKDHIIDAAVYNRRSGAPVLPRASICRDIGGSTFEKISDWTNECGTREEVERLSIELAKRAIDEGQGFD